MSTSTIPRTDGQPGQVPYPQATARKRTLWDRFTRKQWMAIGAGFLVLVLLLTSVLVMRSKASAPVATQPVAQQTLVQTVSASGTVNPQNLITVGSQVSGNISQLYVDFNTKVKKGQVLAKIEPSTFDAQLQQNEATLAQAQANLAAQEGASSGAQSGITAQIQAAKAAGDAIATAQASVTKAQSAVQLAQSTVNRDAALLKQGYIAPNQVQTDQDALVQAQTGLQSAQAALTQTRAQAAQSTAQVGVSQGTSSQAANQVDADAAAVQSAEAQVQQARLNVNYTTITSPVDGTVIDREVTIGQTVAAGFQAPTLFTIAQDLRKMEVDISVGETDIGSIKTGQKVTFTVLAYPNDTFNGVVTQVRDNATTTSNVVTYTVVTVVDNSSGKLLPGMTATALIQVASAPNALVVPTSALQFRPTGRHARHATASATGSPLSNASNASPWGQASGAGSSAVVSGTNGLIFVQRTGSFGSNRLTPVPVKIVLVTGTQAAVSPINGTKLSAGDPVVIGYQNATTAAQQQASQNRLGGMGRVLGH